MLGQLDWITLVLVALAAFSTALIHSVTGFAGALILSVCLAPLIGVRAVVPVVAFAMVISNINRVFLFREHIDWKAYRAVMITGLPAIVFGAVVYLFLPVKAIAIILGCFLIISIALRRMLEKRNYNVGYSGLSTVGAVYGVVAGTVFGAGLILGPFLLGAGVVGQGLIGTVAALGLTLNLTKSLVFGVGDLLNRELISLSIVVGLCTIPGGLLGKWIIKRFNVEIHTLIVETLMFVGGCYFIYQGIYLH